MPAYVEIINKILSLGTIFLQVIIFLLIINLVFIRNRENKVLLFFKKYTFYFGFLISLGAVLLSLFYSNIVGFPPCELCWIERIFIYPQLILFSMELYKRDRSIVDFSIVFAILGSLVSIYHVFVESGVATGITCAIPNSANPNIVSCAIRYVFEFGYITIPIMALTSSLFLLILLLNYKYISKIK
jgi:disulfide bond formation protein DsbB